MRSTSEAIICTYNGAAFVREQLRSVLAQTRRLDRISIYDDQSSDDTVSCIRDFVSGLPADERRLFTIHVNATNLGYARNFVNGIAGATEDVLFLCDQDDVWETHKAETLLNLLDEHATDMAFSDGSLIEDSGETIDATSVLESYGLSSRQIHQFRDCSFELLLRRNYINGAAAAVRRTTAQQALPLPCDMPHDYWLAIWCALHNGIAATPERLYRYRLHDRNVIGLGSSNLLYQWLGIWRQPNAPRERELLIWKAVTERIAALPCSRQVDAARRKVAWLSRVVPQEKKSFVRTYEILKSALNGSYRDYSGAYSFLRDVVSLIR